MPVKPTYLTEAGIRRELQQSVDSVPDTWSAHSQVINLNTASERFPWLGDLPTPRVMTDGRLFQDIGQYRYDIDSETHELSMIINRTMWEDDQVGAIQSRVQQLGQSWGAYYSYLHAQMLVNGATATYVAWDGNTFFHDTRTVGASAAIDNKKTSNATAATTIPTASEFLDAIETCKTTMARFQSDKGKPTPNIAAMSRIGVIIPPSYERAATTAVRGTVIPSQAATASLDNVYGMGIAEVFVNPWLTADTKMYVHAMGAVNKAIIFAKRTELEIIIKMGPEDMALYDGVLIMCRQRFNFKYGDFYKMIEYTYS